ncbi:PREDICTED: tonin-like [Ceratosolen solmsi marchali]|uniref:Tonin-like n=1 Tax=Ceratosolen solmsi marchali TaxID=326594 RepID=A0AAJ6VMQ2_9HYME|nr:PREDICTED: tonin-like [Ceratosolen solmsi marchali]
MGVTAGWGTINNNVIPTNLYAGNLTIITNVECINTIEIIQHQRIIVPAKFVCTKAEPYLLSAPGDSGSPLIVDGILIAITKGATPNIQGFHPYRANAHLTVQRYNNYIETLVSPY